MGQVSDKCISAVMNDQTPFIASQNTTNLDASLPPANENRIESLYVLTEGAPSGGMPCIAASTTVPVPDPVPVLLLGVGLMVVAVFRVVRKIACLNRSGDNR